MKRQTILNKLNTLYLDQTTKARVINILEATAASLYQNGYIQGAKAHGYLPTEKEAEEAYKTYFEPKKK